MTQHNKHHVEEHEQVDKPIKFNFGIIKGALTFKQFIVIITVASILSLIVFSSIKINNSIIQYNKESLKVDKNTLLKK